MRAAVHPDRPELHVRAEVLLVGNDFLCGRILFFPDPELERPAVNMRQIVGLTLVLEDRHTRNVETLGVPAGGIAYWNARDVAPRRHRSSVSSLLPRSPR